METDNYKNKLTNMKVGHIVYFLEHWSRNIIKAQIEKLQTIDNQKAAEVKCLLAVDKNGNILCKSCGNCTQPLTNLYFSPSELYNALQQKRGIQIQKYCDEIKNTSDLLKFPLIHCLNGDEYTDYEAIAAYKRKTKELLGIDLNKTNDYIKDETSDYDERE